MLGVARRSADRRQRHLPEQLIHDIEVWAGRVGVGTACAAFGVAPRTWRHHRAKQAGQLPVRPSRATGQPRRAHPAKLDAGEEQAVLDVLCSDRFADAGVAEVWATLLDEGVYLCSESTMHRILRDHGLAGQRRQGVYKCLCKGDPPESLLSLGGLVSQGGNNHDHDRRTTDDDRCER